MLFLVLLASQLVWAGKEPPYSAFTIDAKLSKGNNAVIRTDEMLFTVKSAKSATTTVKKAITVLNADGKKHAQLVVHYDKLSKIDFIRGTLYDMMGKKIRSLKNAEIKDFSANGEGTMFGDDRAKVVEIANPSYPYTVEFEYQRTSFNMLFYPTWLPLSRGKVAVEASSFQVIMPAGMDLRFHEQHLPQKGSISVVNGQKVYQWQAKNLVPIEEEAYSPDYYDIVPRVRAAPTAFEVEGYAGTLDSWKAFGDWQNKLNAGRSTLPETTRQQILTLTASLKTPEEKIKAVYQFMQNRTRYVSIQLGIGGWQPFEASFVDAQGYGDCKALSNYTKSLLEVAGIASHYAIIYGGEDNQTVLKDFPSNQFNHVILCVPTARDTVWLECTDQMGDVGYTGSNTGDRYSLLVTPEGGKLVPTPRFTAVDNTQKRSIKVKLNAQGGGTGKVVTTFTGRQHESRSNVLNQLGPDEQLKWLYRNTKIPAFEIKNYSLQKAKDTPRVTEELQLELPKLASVSGRRMFITPNLMNRSIGVPLTTPHRKYEVVLNYPYYDVDTVEFEIPAGFKPESVPPPVKISTAFGTYQSKVSVQEGKLVYLREMTMYHGRFAPAKYQELVDFLKQVSRADQQQVVFAAESI